MVLPHRAVWTLNERIHMKGLAHPWYHLISANLCHLFKLDKGVQGEKGQSVRPTPEQLGLQTCY